MKIIEIGYNLNLAQIDIIVSLCMYQIVKEGYKHVKWEYYTNLKMQELQVFFLLRKHVTYICSVHNLTLHTHMRTYSFLVV